MITLEKAHGIAYDLSMKIVSTTEARKNLYQLVDEANDEQVPIHITGKRGNAVLVSEEEWRGTQETLYLISIPGMKESLIEGMEEPIENCSTELPW